MRTAPASKSITTSLIPTKTPKLRTTFDLAFSSPTPFAALHPDRMAMSGDPSRSHPPPTTSPWMQYPESWTGLSPVHMQSPEPLERVGIAAAMNGFANLPASGPTAQSARAPFRGQPSSSAPSYGLNGGNGNHRFGLNAFAPQPQPQPQPQPLVRAVVRNLSPNTTEDALRLMLVFSNELVDIELINNSSEIAYHSAILYFRTINGALEAQTNLNGRANINNTGSMVVDVLGTSTYSSPNRRTPNPVPLASPSATSTVDPFTAAVARPQPNVGNGFPSHDAMSPTMRGRFFGTVPTHQDLAAPDTEASNHYRNLFNPQSPIGNHLANELPGRLGKYIINNELGDDDDSELLRDPIGYAEHGTPAQRRATAPNIPVSQMASLSINTSAPPPLPSYIPALTSPVHGVNGSNGFMRGGQQQQQQQQQQRRHSPQNHHPLTRMPQQRPQQSQQSRSQPQQHQQDKSPRQHLSKPQQQDRQQQQSNQQVPYGRANFPPVNPADQNPPCNTLYVGNLPVDTAEEELKAMFCKQRGYKRLCFRTKANGPMCFVEFEDISLATRALNEMYGVMLHNSTKGGIRLSFSKNPLGVRSGQPSSQVSQTAMPPMNGVVPSNISNAFAAASGPPPGLSVPPGLASRITGYGHSITNQRNTNFSSLPSNGNNHRHQHGQDSYFAYTSSNNGNGTVVSFSNAGSSRTTPFYTNGASRPAKPRTPFA
ncbi:hypothetical protein HDV63DRAFT_396575 [Trichoderma sp. SZMC 28014]